MELKGIQMYKQSGPEERPVHGEGVLCCQRVKLCCDLCSVISTSSPPWVLRTMNHLNRLWPARQMTEFLRSLIVRRAPRIKLQGQWNTSATRRLKDNNMILAWTMNGRKNPYLRKVHPFFLIYCDHFWWNACFGGGPTEPNRASFKNYLQKPSPCRTNP